MKNNDDIPTADTNEIKRLINRVKRGELDQGDAQLISATKYERPVLRCSDCFKRYAANLPEGVKMEENATKYVKC
jgi:hypothetical protein